MGGIEAARDGLEALMEGRFAGKIVIFPQLTGLPLLELAELAENYPSIGALMDDGHSWTWAAEAEAVRDLLETDELLIVTLTLNPSLDRTFVIERLARGELNRATQVWTDPAGKGVNVAKALHAHGVDTLAVLPIGGASGSELLRLLELTGVPSQAGVDQGCGSGQCHGHRGGRHGHQAQRAGSHVDRGLKSRVLFPPH